MDIKCAALVLLVLAVTVELTATLPREYGSFLKIQLGGIMEIKDPEAQKMEKKSLKDADMNLDKYLASGLADKRHSRHIGSPPLVGVVMTRYNVKLHSGLRKREKRHLKDADKYFSLGLADKPHSRHKRVPPGPRGG